MTASTCALPTVMEPVLTLSKEAPRTVEKEKVSASPPDAAAAAALSWQVRDSKSSLGDAQLSPS
jgi:hypothetical protein